MKLAYQYIAFLFNFSTTSNHLQPLQAENCDCNSRLVVDEDVYDAWPTSNQHWFNVLRLLGGDSDQDRDPLKTDPFKWHRDLRSVCEKGE